MAIRFTNTAGRDAQNYRFEAAGPPRLKRDAETGNDDFGARYYSSRLGRWLSADWSAVPVAVPYANLANPQTLNLYAMVRDNPETFADLDGHLGEGTGFGPQANMSGLDGECSEGGYDGDCSSDDFAAGAGQLPGLDRSFSDLDNFADYYYQAEEGRKQRELLKAEQNMVAALVCAESCSTGEDGQKAVASAILNRANSGEKQYVASGKDVNVTNVVESGQFQGYSTNLKSVYQKALAGTLNNTPGFKSAQAAVADVLKNGVTTNATFIFNGKSPPSSGWFGRAVQNGTLVPATPAKVDDWYLYVPH